MYLYTRPVYHSDLPVHSRTYLSQKLNEYVTDRSIPHPNPSQSLLHKEDTREPTTQEQKGWITRGPFYSLITLLSVIRLFFVKFSYHLLFLTDITSIVWKHTRDYWAETEVKRLALVLHSPARGWQLYSVALIHPSHGSV